VNKWINDRKKHYNKHTKQDILTISSNLT